MSTIDISTSISIICGFLLTLSEILPFLTNIKSNGILEHLIIILKNKGEEIINPELTESYNKINILVDKLNIILTRDSENVQSKLDIVIDKISNQN